MTFKLGLTGSIGMGKTTTANLFKNAGCDVWSADSAVERLYQIGGKAVQPIKELFPKSIVAGKVSKKKLRQILELDPVNFKKLENIVHPLVAEDRDCFIKGSLLSLIVLEIPLLFETGSEKNMDAVACVKIDYETQKARVLERKLMTLKQFEQIVSKQLPIEEKCSRADYIITTENIEETKKQVTEIVAEIESKKLNA